MAVSLNKVMLIGNLTRDPELRYIPSGQAVTTFTIAVNRTFNSKAGEKKEEVAFIRIVAWARLAEICNEYLKKGRPVFVEGRIQTRSWDGPDGNKRYSTEVVADKIGVQRKWIQHPGERGREHYDVCSTKRKLAVEAGAIELKPHDFIKKLYGRKC